MLLPGEKKAEIKWVLLLCLLISLMCMFFYWHNPGTFWQDDYQSYFMPGFHDIGRALSQGEFPLLSPWSWFGGDLVGEYQYGLFNPFEMLCYFLLYKLHLSLALSACILSTIHLLMMAIGTFLLCRQRKLSSELAVFAAIVFTFSGWCFSWGVRNWYTALSGTMWLPWLWLNLEKALEKRRYKYMVFAAAVLYLLITAGFPYAILMGFAVSVYLYITNLGKDGLWKPFKALAIIWLIGVGLSAPAWMSLIQYSGFTVRNTGLGPQESGKWTVPITAIWGMFEPYFPSVWRVYNGSFTPRQTIELFNGALPGVFIILSLVFGRGAFIKKYQSLFIFASCVLLFAMLPGYGGFRFSFKWLALFQLIIALIAAESLAFLLANEKYVAFIRNKLVYYLVSCELIISSISRYLVYCNQGSDGYDINPMLMFLSVFVLFGLLVKRVKIGKIIPISLLAICALFFIVYLNINMAESYPHWNFRDSLLTKAPLNKNTRYLSFYLDDDIYPIAGDAEVSFGDYLRPANLPMLSGIECIQGYSPQGHYGLVNLFSFRWFGQIKDLDKAKRILIYESGPNGLLALMGINGIVLSRRFWNDVKILEKNGWQLVSKSNAQCSNDFAIIMERKNRKAHYVQTIRESLLVKSRERIISILNGNHSSEVPILLWDPRSPESMVHVHYSKTKVRLLDKGRNRTVLWVKNCSNRRRSLVLISRPWYPGYHAKINGKEMPVKVINMLMPAVEIPPGTTGTLVVYFLPGSVKFGLLISGGMLFLCLGMLILGRGKKIFVYNEPAMEGKGKTIDSREP